MSLLNNTIAADLESGAYTARLISYKEVDDRIHKPSTRARSVATANSGVPMNTIFSSSFVIVLI